MSRDLPGTASNYLSIGDVAAIDITGTALTVSAWVNPDTANSLDFVVSKGVDTTNVQYNLYGNSGTLATELGDATGHDDASFAAAYVTGSWQHLAVRKNGTGAVAIALFRNGSLLVSGVSNRSIQNTANALFIGQRSDNNAITAMDGLVAEVAIYNAALSDPQIASLAAGANPTTVQAANLKGYWPLYGDVSPEPDYSGSGNVATIVGTVPKGATHPAVAAIGSGVGVSAMTGVGWWW